MEIVAHQESGKKFPIVSFSTDEWKIVTGAVRQQTEAAIDRGVYVVQESAVPQDPTYFDTTHLLIFGDTYDENIWLDIEPPRIAGALASALRCSYPVEPEMRQRAVQIADNLHRGFTHLGFEEEAHLAREQ